MFWLRKYAENYWSKLSISFREFFNASRELSENIYNADDNSCSGGRCHGNDDTFHDADDDDDEDDRDRSSFCFTQPTFCD